MSFEVKLDPEGAKELVQKAMFELLTEESREALIKSALEQLTQRPPSSGYGSRQPPSPIEDSFNIAMNRIATQVVAEYLEDAVIKEQIREQILTVLKKMVDDKGAWLYEQIGYGVGEKIKEVLQEKSNW